MNPTSVQSKPNVPEPLKSWVKALVQEEVRFCIASGLIMPALTPPTAPIIAHSNTATEKAALRSFPLQKLPLELRIFFGKIHCLGIEL